MKMKSAFTTFLIILHFNALTYFANCTIVIYNYENDVTAQQGLNRYKNLLIKEFFSYVK